MKYEVKFTGQFKKDLKKAQKQGKDLDDLFAAVEVLAEGGKLDPSYRDHDLTGEFRGSRECHIAPDWLLIYEIRTMCSCSCSIGPVHTPSCLEDNP